ncbi:MAG TPA: acetyltransferase [Coleofasciculaceae cyanobacterium]
MLLKDKQTDTLVEIHDVETLINPTQSNVSGQIQAGQEEQNPTSFEKEKLKFPSGEELPICWKDADYHKA